MKLDNRHWVIMTWSRTNIQYVSRQPVAPAILRSAFQKASCYTIDDCVYNSSSKTGRVFLMSEADEDDEDEGPWSQECVYTGELPVMSTPCSGALSSVRLRFSGE
jgi:hypothetical protein